MVIYGAKLKCKIERIQLKEKNNIVDVIMFIGYRDKETKIKKIFFAYAEDDLFYIPKIFKEAYLIKDMGFWNFSWIDKHDYKTTIECVNRQSSYIQNQLIAQLYKRAGKRVFRRLFGLSGKVVNVENKQ